MHAASLANPKTPSLRPTARPGPSPGLFAAALPGTTNLHACKGGTAWKSGTYVEARMCADFAVMLRGATGRWRPRSSRGAKARSCRPRVYAGVTVARRGCRIQTTGADHRSGLGRQVARSIAYPYLACASDCSSIPVARLGSRSRYRRLSANSFVDPRIMSARNSLSSPRSISR